MYSWSENGEILISGSDDTHICIWDARDGIRLAYIIHTGHQQNIFNVKLLPPPNDHILVSCAADNEIRVFDLGRLVTNPDAYISHNHPVINDDDKAQATKTCQ